MFKDTVTNLLRQAYDAAMFLPNGRERALTLIHEALQVAKQSNDRVLRAHVVQCAERVKGTL